MLPDTVISTLPSPHPLPATTGAAESALRAKAGELEAGFLAEMLGHAGLDAGAGPFAGGVGEEQFASFLRQAQAEAMVKAGGIGLAESIFRALTAGQTAEAPHVGG